MYKSYVGNGGKEWWKEMMCRGIPKSVGIDEG